MSISEDQLVGQHAPMVRRVAMQLISRLPASVELDDLMQAGMMGLLDAVRRYQQTPDAQFETYAMTRVRGAMLDELRSQDWLPRSVRTKARSLETAVHRLNNKLLREPTEVEIAEELNMSLADYQVLLEEARGAQIVHYEDLARGQSDSNEEGLDMAVTQAEGEWCNPLNQLISDGLRAALIKAIDELPEREKLLFSLQFEQDLNQKEIGVVMGITEGRVSQLRSQAVARIRAKLAQNAWNESPGEYALHTLI